MTGIIDPHREERLLAAMSTLTNRLLVAEDKIRELEQDMLLLLRGRSRALESSPGTHTSWLETGPGVPSTPLPGPYEPDPNWHPVFHRQPPEGCGKVAQYLIRKVSPTESAKRSLLRVRPLYGPTASPTPWHSPEPSAVARCSSCGRQIDPLTARDLDWYQAIERPTDSVRQTSEYLDPDDPESWDGVRIKHAAPVTPDADAEQRTSLESAMAAARALGYQPDAAPKAP